MILPEHESIDTKARQRLGVSTESDTVTDTDDAPSQGPSSEAPPPAYSPRREPLQLPHEHAVEAASSNDPEEETPLLPDSARRRARSRFFKALVISFYLGVWVPIALGLYIWQMRRLGLGHRPHEPPRVRLLHFQHSADISP
jgi:hypothetical protein